MTSFYSHGKLLLTGEYLVLDGAKSLAIPTAKGQTLEVVDTLDNRIIWISKTVQDKIWFASQFLINSLDPVLDTEKNESTKKAQVLSKILKEAKKLNPSFLNKNKGVTVTTRLEFDLDWGLGSSSTLINNIAQWANVNAFQLLEESFGGSGYDIAAAQNATPIVYQRQQPQPIVTSIDFDPPFSDLLYFVHLNQKKDSKDAIKHYRNQPQPALVKNIEIINRLTQNLLQVNSILDFEKVINTHEHVLSQILKTETIKSLAFPDYEYSIKSLGGWGGDFVLVTIRSPKDLSYFKEKGYSTILPYSEMIFKN